MKIPAARCDPPKALPVSIRRHLISLDETMKGIFYYQASAWRSRQAGNGP
jgi:hypothetical protein